MNVSFMIRPTANGWLVTEQTSSYLDKTDVASCYSFNSQEELIKYIRKLLGKTASGNLRKSIVEDERSQSIGC